MSSFKMYMKTKNKEIPNNKLNKQIISVKTEQQVSILTNFNDDFGDDTTININGNLIILQANTTKLHYS